MRAVEARKLLRRATRWDHERVEANALMTRLVGPDCDLTTLRSVVAAHLSLYRTMEPRIRRQMPECVRQHREFRFREPLAAADFADLRGAADLIPTCSVPSFECNAAWAGYLYVVEGASLGGRLITTRLEKLKPAPVRSPLRTFLPYGKAPGAVWQRFSAILQAQLDSDPSRIAAISAARRTFRLYDSLFTRAQDSVHE